jgi:hypothetical protein
MDMKSMEMRIEYLERMNGRLEALIASQERHVALLEDRLARYEEPKPRLAIVRQIRPM